MSLRGAAVLLIVCQLGLAPALAEDEPDPAPAYETVVRSPRPRQQPVETAVGAGEGRCIAGTGSDPVKAVQNLPGVARASFGSGELIVWGAAPRDTRVEIDGVEVPLLYHLGGVRSIVNSDLIAGVTLVPGAYGADHGRGLGGLAQVQTRALPLEGVHGALGADLLDASALVTAAISERLQIGLAGRYGYLDRIVARVAPEAGEYLPVPQYADYQLKATLRLREGEQLTALSLGANDALRRAVPAADPAAVRAESTDLDLYRLSVRYARILPDDAVAEVTPFFGFTRARQSAALGAVPARLGTDSYCYGVRARYRRYLAPRLRLALGIDVLGARSSVERFGSMTLPAREGDLYVFGQPPGDDVATDAFAVHVLDAAPYASLELKLGPVTITSGLRASPFFVEGDQLTPRVGQTPPIGFSRLEWAVEPRLAVAWRVHPALTVSVAAGLYHQTPEPEDLSAVFGNPTLGLERAVHVTGGVAVRITRSLALELGAFYRKLDELIARSSAPAPALARALVPEGSGASYGGQLLLRRELARGFFGWLSYTLSRSERRDQPGGPVRLFDYDQTHVLALVASYEIRGWTFGGRLRFSSGFPRTPVTSAFYSVRGDAYQPVFGSPNSVRMPSFFQLDLRVEKLIRWSRLALRLYLDLQNVTCQRNAEEIAYSQDFSRRGFITGLPALAVLGTRIEF